MPAQGSVREVRFGDFGLDLDSNELRRHGHKLPVPDQAVQILAMLLERPGEVVTREQLIARLWPNGTVVEFDHGINSSVRRLRAALNDSAERPVYIETLPKRGYRFIFPVQLKTEVGTAGEPEVKPREAEEPRSPGRAKWLWAGVAPTILIVFAGWLLHLRTANEKLINSIAVLPLVNATNDSGAEYLSDGIAEEIINALSTISDLKVIARTSAFRFKGKDVDPRGAGRELGVSAVFTGTLKRHGDELVIHTDLVKVADGSELWGGRFQRRVSELQSLQAEIAPEIASKLGLTLKGDQEKRLTKRYTEDSEAYELFLKAAHSESILEIIDYLKRSIRKDPKFALGYARLAYEYALASDARVLATKMALQKVREAATRALELDGGLGESHVTLARILLNLDWDWRGAETEFRRGIDLDPNSGHIFYALYLMFVGRQQESLLEAQRAEEIDPLSPEVQGRLGLVHNCARQYDWAIQRWRAPGPHPWFRVPAAFALAETGGYGESIAILKSFSPPRGAGLPGRMGYAYAKAGDRAEAERIRLELEKMDRTQGLGAYEVAFIDGVLGRKDEAFKWREIAFQQHDAGLKFLNVDSCLDPLRSDPRFNDLVRRVGLTP